MRWWCLLCTRRTRLVGFLCWHNDDDDVRFVLDISLSWIYFSASRSEQQSTCRHVALHPHNILIPTEPVSALSPSRCVHSRETTNTNVIFFHLTRQGLEPTVYHTRVFHLTRQGLEPTVYHTRGEHANCTPPMIYTDIRIVNVGHVLTVLHQRVSWWQNTHTHNVTYIFHHVLFKEGDIGGATDSWRRFGTSRWRRTDWWNS